MDDDSELLRRYAEEGSEEAFAELVHRHLGLVYGAAARQLQDPHLAEDVVQGVFTDLARKAPALQYRPILASWLYKSTHYAAAKILRADRRRRARDQETNLMPDATSEPAQDAEWNRLRPILDREMNGLAPRDREAILLRFFEQSSFTRIAAALRVSEDGARKRVDRALERLRRRLVRRGISSTGGALALALTDRVCSAAPASFATTVANQAIVQAGATGFWTSLVSWMHFMSKTKTASIAAASLAFLAVGSATYETHQAHAARGENATLTEALANLRQQVLRSERQNTTLQIEASNLQRPATTGAAPSGSAQLPLTEGERFFLDRQKMLAEDRMATEFLKLGLSESQLEQYGTLATNAFWAQFGRNGAAGAREAGMPLAQYKADLQNTLDHDIRELMGDEIYARFQQDQTSTQAAPGAGPAVQQLADYLTSSEVPLSSQAASQLIGILSGNAAALKNSPGSLPDTVIAQVQGILSPAQIASWQRLRSIQKQTDDQIASADARH